MPRAPFSVSGVDMENELAFYISQGVGGGPSVMDKRYEFYRDGRPVGLSSDDYRRLYFLDLLGADVDDPRSTSDLEAAWFGAQGFERAEGFAAAYVGDADLTGEAPLVPEVVTSGPITSDSTPVSATVALPGGLVEGDTLVIAARSQNGIADDPMLITEYAEVSINNSAGGRQLALIAATDFVAPGPASVTVTRTSATSSRTAYAPIILRNVDIGTVAGIIAASSGPVNWSGPLDATVDDTLFLLVIGWENLAGTSPIYGPSSGVMAGATEVIRGLTAGDPELVTTTGIIVYAKLMPIGSYSMTDTDITVVSGTGSGTGPTALLVAIEP